MKSSLSLLVVASVFVAAATGLQAQVASFDRQPTSTVSVLGGSADFTFQFRVSQSFATLGVLVSNGGFPTLYRRCTGSRSAGIPASSRRHGAPGGAPHRTRWRGRLFGGSARGEGADPRGHCSCSQGGRIAAGRRSFERSGDCRLNACWRTFLGAVFGRTGQCWLTLRAAPRGGGVPSRRCSRCAPPCA